MHGLLAERREHQIRIGEAALVAQRLPQLRFERLRVGEQLVEPVPEHAALRERERRFGGGIGVAHDQAGVEPDHGGGEEIQALESGHGHDGRARRCRADARCIER